MFRTCLCYRSRRCLSRAATTRTISYIQKPADPGLQDVAEQPDRTASPIRLRVPVPRTPIVAVRHFPASTDENLKTSYIPTMWSSVCGRRWKKKNLFSSTTEEASGRTATISERRRASERASEKHIKVVDGHAPHMPRNPKSAPPPPASR